MNDRHGPHQPSIFEARRVRRNCGGSAGAHAHSVPIYIHSARFAVSSTSNPFHLAAIASRYVRKAKKDHPMYETSLDRLQNVIDKLVNEVGNHSVGAVAWLEGPRSRIDEFAAARFLLYPCHPRSSSPSSAIPPEHRFSPVLLPMDSSGESK